MKTHIKKIKNLIWDHKIVSIVVILVVLFIAFKIFGGGGTKKELFTVKQGDVVQKVIVNGKTKAVNSVNLAFEINGTVKSSNVSVGTRVVAGQSLVTLDQNSVYANLLKAKANLLSEQVRLDELNKGTRPEEIAISETEVENAKVALTDAQKNLADKVKDVVSNNIDQLFSNPHSNSPSVNLSSSNSQLIIDVNTKRFEIESIINNWVYTTGETNVSVVSAFIDKVASLVNSQNSTPNLTQATLDGYKSSLSSARATVISASGALNTAKSALALAQKNLSLKKGGSTPEAIKAQEAKVMQNEAEVSSIESQLSKMTLRSPQNGIVTVQDAKVGEVVTPGKVVVSVISDNNLEIESNVSEINVGKVTVGNLVDITFDAFPGEVFNGTVTYVEPAETIIDGVVNYKVTVAFSKNYPQMKSGLTSKLEIITGTKTGVLVIPQYSIKNTTEGSFVLKQVGDTFVETPITVGLRGQDGFMEIVQGLVAGDVVESVATN